MSQHQMAEVTLDVARGVGYIHSRGFLHLDLEPSNIMLEGRVRGQQRAPRAKVVDLGIALAMEPGKPYALQEDYQ